MNRRLRLSFILKWSLIIVLILLFVTIAYLIFLYYETQQHKTSGYDDAKRIVLRETSIIEIDDIFRFHGDQAYHVIFGKTEKNEEKIVFVPFEYTEGEPLIVVNKADIVSKETIVNNWQKQCTNCKLVKIIPGILNNEPLWEITYIDSANRYVFDYLSIHDGSQYEQLRFKRMFK